MKRKIVSILLSATMLLGAVSLSACVNNELEAKIAELETRIAQLEQEKQELENEITALEVQLNESAKSEAFYSLKEAYSLSYITKNNLMNIIYHYMGTVYQVEDNSDSSNWIELDYISDQELGELDSSKEILIKSSFIKSNKSLFVDMNDEEAVKSLSVEFLGIYNGCYAVIIDSELWNYGDAIIPQVIDGIGWWQKGASIRLYVEEK